MSDQIITLDRIKYYRQKVFKTSLQDRIHTLDEAVDFINERGLIAFWPLNGIPFPSLWSATAGERLVPDEHDDPGHITWGWKDELLGQHRCFYARILCNRTFFVSLDLLPNLYALSKNMGDPAEDHNYLYQSGELSNTAFNIYESLLNSGPLDTLTIKRVTRLTGKEGDREFNHAIDSLQNDLKIMPVGISRIGGWNYAYKYDLVPRHFPELIDQSRIISDQLARNTLLCNYFRSIGVAQENEIRKFFRWDAKFVRLSLDELVSSQKIVRSITMDKELEIPGFAIVDII